MKKTLTINLNGRVFNIDEDAYQLLDNYFRNLRIYFRKEEGYTEIVADFEAHIEELLSNRVRLGYDVINIEEVEKVITQMGSPDDFGEEEKAAESSETKKEPEASAKKKFYRDGDDKMLGGVLSGLAAYCDCAVLPIRIIAIILLFVSAGWITLAYLIVWIVVPEAKTAEQKLEMQGKPITVENIGKTVAAGAEKVSKQAGGCLGSIVDFFVAFLKVIAVGLGCLVGIPLVFALFIVIIVLFATLFGVGTELIHIGSLPFVLPWANGFTIAVIPAFLIVVIPILALLYAIISATFKFKPLHKGIKLTGLIVWIIALISFFGFGIKGWSEHGFRTRIPGEISWNIQKEEIQGDGILTDRTASVGEKVQRVELEGNLNANFIIEQLVGEVSTLLINGDSNVIDKINVESDAHGNLKLSTKNNYDLRPSAPIIIRLQTADLEEIKVSGVSRINITGSFQTDELRVNASGVSNITFDDLQANNLKARASGTSEIFLSGTVKKADLHASGSSKIFALDLVSEMVFANASGVSFISSNPTEFFKGKASGSSTIKYKQMPEREESKVSGVGKIIQE
jgi:phage shock protein PspC (stress-responsive transcriptional regulator)